MFQVHPFRVRLWLQPCRPMASALASEFEQNRPAREVNRAPARSTHGRPCTTTTLVRLRLRWKSGDTGPYLRQELGTTAKTTRRQTMKQNKALKKPLKYGFSGDSEEETTQTYSKPFDHHAPWSIAISSAKSRVLHDAPNGLSRLLRRTV